jgi:hypothetical protein
LSAPLFGGSPSRSNQLSHRGFFRIDFRRAFLGVFDAKRRVSAFADTRLIAVFFALRAFPFSFAAFVAKAFFFAPTDFSSPALRGRSCPVSSADDTTAIAATPVWSDLAIRANGPSIMPFAIAAAPSMSASTNWVANGLGFCAAR